VTWGGGTGTGNTISSTESCQRGRGGVGARVNERAAAGRMRLPRRWGRFRAALPSGSNLLGVEARGELAGAAARTGNFLGGRFCQGEGEPPGV
jgi:hypothetical protein